MYYIGHYWIELVGSRDYMIIQKSSKRIFDVMSKKGISFDEMIVRL